MRLFKILAISASALLTFQSAALADTLSAEQVKSVMVGKRIDWVTLDGGTKGHSKYKRNGTATVSITGPNKLKDTGSWRIVGNRFCSTWKVIRDGQEGCSTIRTTDEAGLYRLDTVFVRSK